MKTAACEHRAEAAVTRRKKQKKILALPEHNCSA
jgi:hypothetical protein